MGYAGKKNEYVKKKTAEAVFLVLILETSYR